MIYFAYGSNLNISNMAQRCPAAEPLGYLALKDWRLVFRGVADCIPEQGAVCHGGVWKITPACEAALDIYEGVRNGMYRKVYIPLKRMPDGEDKMLIYVMNSTGIMPPPESYLERIEQGYRDFDMPKKAFAALKRTVRESWDDKAPSHIERKRHRRNGRPRLAQPPKITGHASDRDRNHAGSSTEKSKCDSSN